MSNGSDSFTNQLRIQKFTDTQLLIYHLKCGKIQIADLTNSQKESICRFLKNEIAIKKIKLKNMKNKILYSKLKNSQNINHIFNKVSIEDRQNFIEYCKHLNI